MADIDLTSITVPISDDQPCGPDLDMEFDGDFMNFEANVGMAWPERYFSWDPAALKGHTYYDQIADLLERSRDLRLLVPLAKLRILEGDIIGFAEVLDSTLRLMKDHWADLHPQPGDFLELGMGQLSTLDDNASCVLPFQHAKIVASRRSGPITYRKWLVGTGEVNPREEEDRIDAGTLAAAIAEAESDEVDKALTALRVARDALAGIRLVCIEEAGYEAAPALENLPKAIEGAIAMVENATGTSDDTGDEDVAPQSDSSIAAAGAGNVVVQLPAGAVENREAAIEAMHAAAKYFALFEPSSPAPMLLREAQSAATKSFYELVNDLVPDTAASAFVTLGREPWFEVSLTMLDQRNPSPDYNESGEEQVDNGGWESAGLEDEILTDNDALNQNAGDGNHGDAASDENDEYLEAVEISAESTEDSEVSGGDNDDYAEVLDVQDNHLEDNTTDDTEHWGNDEDHQESPRFVANSRPEAIDLINKVLTYYRLAEPSSPVSLILERALELSTKNFIELLGDVLPDGSLKAKTEEEAPSSGW